MDVIAWLILRITFAWMFLYPLTMLLSDWQAAKGNVAMVFPKFHHELAILMVVAMIIGALSILFGILPHLGGLILLVYSLIGAVVHYRFASTIQDQHLSSQVSSDDQSVYQQVQTMGAVGHITSAQKNFVLAAVACWFMLMGTGPLSLVDNVLTLL